jgi:signal transduction histidine kinase
MSDPRAYEALAPTDSHIPWDEWLERPDTDLATWLADLDAQLTTRAASLSEEEAQATALWCHMSKGLHRFRPEEVEDVVNAQLHAARRCAALEALRVIVRVEREHLAESGRTAPDTIQDSVTMRKLLESLATDRMITGRALTGEVLETLCSIALDLELTERRVGHDPASISQALTDLRGHTTTAAHMVRALPDHVQVRAETGEELAFAVRRCLVRYSGSLEVELTWSGGEAGSAESASALLWVLQEVLHHLHHAVAGWAKVTVRSDSQGIAMRVETPSPALTVSRSEPGWLLRSRLRLELAGGSISAAASGESTYVDVRIP